jgi:hypothetical protein
MYMYFVQRFDDGVKCNPTLLVFNQNDTNEEKEPDVCTCNADSQEHFCTWKDSFHNVFGYLAGGPGDTKDGLDILCGVVVVIIFLNVVIGIVSNAW